MNEDQKAFQELIFCLQALAADATDQINLFPSSVCVTCELLLDFDNCYKATIWRKSLNLSSE